jgi:integrase
VFALRRCLAAAVADRRIMSNPAADVPLPSERAKTPRFLSQTEVELLAAEVPERYRAPVLVGAYAGLRWGEAVGLTRGSVDMLRSRILVRTTAVEVHRRVTLGHEPKTKRSQRSRARSCADWKSTLGHYLRGEHQARAGVAPGRRVFLISSPEGIRTRATALRG